MRQAETKKIAIVKEIGHPALISIDFDDFTCSFTPWYLFRFRRHIKHSRQCFIGYLNTPIFVKNTPLRRIFNCLLGVWISRWNNVSRVWYVTWKRYRGYYHSCYQNVAQGSELTSTSRSMSSQTVTWVAIFITTLFNSLWSLVAQLLFWLSKIRFVRNVFITEWNVTHD